MLAAAVVAALVIFFRGTSLRAMGEALEHTAWPLVILAALLNLTLNTLARAARWRELLPAEQHPDGPRGRPSLLDMAMLVLAGQAANNLLPLRGGEAVRAAGLRVRHGYPFNRLIGAQLIEKLVEVLSLTAFALPLLPLAAHAGVRPLLVAAAFLAALGAGAGFLATHLSRRRPSPRFAPLHDAIAVLRHPKVWSRSIGYAMASDAIDVVMIALAGAAVGISFPLTTCCVVLLAVNLAIALPSSPGQLGVLEAGAVIALVGMGVPRENALAFALVYHAAHLVPTTVAGGLILCTARIGAERGVMR